MSGSHKKKPLLENVGPKQQFATDIQGDSFISTNDPIVSSLLAAYPT